MKVQLLKDIEELKENEIIVINTPAGVSREEFRVFTKDRRTIRLQIDDFNPILEEKDIPFDLEDILEETSAFTLNDYEQFVDVMKYLGYFETSYFGQSAIVVTDPALDVGYEKILEELNRYLIVPKFNLEEIIPYFLSGLKVKNLNWGDEIDCIRFDRKFNKGKKDMGLKNYLIEGNSNGRIVESPLETIEKHGLNDEKDWIIFK